MGKRARKMWGFSAHKSYQILKKFIKSQFKETWLRGYNIGLTPMGCTGDIALPELFEIEPINTCNLRCRMCHVSFMNHDQVKSLDTSFLPRLALLKGKWVIVGSNFEPSMHPQFVKIMQYLSDTNCKIDLTTNGTLLKEKITNQLADCNIKNVTISFDGSTKETYEKIRRGANFESAIQRISHFRESLKRNDTFFAVNSVLMRSNIDELIETIDLWELNNFHQIRFIFMVVRSMEENVLKESLYPIRECAFKKLDEAAEYVINNSLKITLRSRWFHQSKLKDFRPNNVAVGLVQSGNKDSMDYFNPRKYYQYGEHPGMVVSCRSPFTFARILWNGNIELCYKYVVGNLKKKDFKDIWYGKKAERVRQKVMANPAICRACDYFRFCVSTDVLDLNDKINHFEQNLIKKSERLDFDVLNP